MKIENFRTDIVTHKKYNKSELIRLVKIDNNVLVDLKGNHAGRGFYIHKDLDAINKFAKFGNQILKVDFELNELISELKELI